MPQPKKAIKVSERDIQTAVAQFLEYDGWRGFRTELTVQRERGRVVGERGQPDYLFLRYVNIPIIKNPRPEIQSLCSAMWIEFKKKGMKSRADQELWHMAERSRGALVLVVDEVDEFTRWYKRDSGLNARWK